MIDGQIAVWVIFDRPADFPNHVVVAVDVVEPYGPRRRPERWLARSVKHARQIIRVLDPSADTRLERDPDDVPCLVETWV